MCRLFLVVRFAILLGCQSEHSSVFKRCVSSSVLLLYISSFEFYDVSTFVGCQVRNSSGMPVWIFFCVETLCQFFCVDIVYLFFWVLGCVDFSWLTGSQFFWVASLQILLSWNAVSVLLCCYCTSLLLSFTMCRLFLVVWFAILLGCQSEYSSLLLGGVNSSVLLLFVWSCYAMPIILHCFAVSVLLGCYCLSLFWVVTVCQFFWVASQQKRLGRYPVSDLDCYCLSLF